VNTVSGMNASSAKITGPGTVMVGLSGGVDSAVAALRLLEAGHDVQALFMKNWDEDDDTEYCTAQADFEDAQRVADRLGIKLHTANFAAEYWDNVFARFLDDYAAGRTPNPDVLCNREIKFNLFIEHARFLGAERIATGHYARGITTKAGFELHKARDAAKDQTYFLVAVPVEQLALCLFPLHDVAKSEVRKVAAAAGLHNHARKDSTGICFIGERRFRDFLGRYLRSEPGPVRSVDGRLIGEHMGLPHYTLGQRQGLGVGGLSGRPESPWYVVDKDLRTNTLLATQTEDDLLNDWLAAPHINWLGQEPTLPLTCTARIRHRQREQTCVLHRRADGGYWAAFDTPQRAITPGQFIAIYSGSRCLGGGVITAFGRRVEARSVA
jgi:tRNA-specific 2-thiouridylase